MPLFVVDVEQLTASSVGNKSTASDPQTSHCPCLPNLTSWSHPIHYQCFILASLPKTLNLVYEESLRPGDGFGDRRKEPIFGYTSTGIKSTHSTEVGSSHRRPYFC